MIVRNQLYGENVNIVAGAKYFGGWDRCVWQWNGKYVSRSRVSLLSVALCLCGIDCPLFRNSTTISLWGEPNFSLVESPVMPTACDQRGPQGWPVGLQQTMLVKMWSKISTCPLGGARSCWNLAVSGPGAHQLCRCTVGTSQVGKMCQRGGDSRNNCGQKGRETFADFTRTRGRSGTQSRHLRVSQYCHLCVKPT